jgi:isoquinoline 1-oxidoreductase subunit beta
MPYDSIENGIIGKPLFTLDYKQEGMLVAMIAHPPAFGLKVKSVDDREARAMPGLKDVFTVKTLADDYERNGFDTTSFTELVVVGNTTWEVMNAKKSLKIEWEESPDATVTVSGWSGKESIKIPAGLESTAVHRQKMAEMAKKPGEVLRKDRDPEGAFKKATKAIEVHFVRDEHDPSGLGEPLFPPIFAAVANALYRATGKRFYEQPFGNQLQEKPPLG